MITCKDCQDHGVRIVELKPPPVVGSLTREDEHEGVYEIQYCVACNALKDNREAAQKLADYLGVKIGGGKKPPAPDDAVCAVCGSDDVEHAMWVTLNTDEVGEVFGSWCNGDNSFCSKCDEHTEIIERHGFDAAKRHPFQASPDFSDCCKFCGEAESHERHTA